MCRTEPYVTPSRREQRWEAGVFSSVILCGASVVGAVCCTAQGCARVLWSVYVGCCPQCLRLALPHEEQSGGVKVCCSLCSASNWVLWTALQHDSDCWLSPVTRVLC